MTTTEARVIIDREESRAWDGLPMAVSKSVYDEAAKIVAADNEAIEAARVAAEVAQLGDLAVVTAGLLDGIDWDEGILDAGKLHFADRRKAAFVDGLTRTQKDAVRAVIVAMPIYQATLAGPAGQLETERLRAAQARMTPSRADCYGDIGGGEYSKVD